MSKLARLMKACSRMLSPPPAHPHPPSARENRTIFPPHSYRQMPGITYIYICIYGGCVDILPTIWQGQKIYALGLLLWPVDFVISASGASSHCADHSQLHAAAPPARPGDGASPEGPIVCNIAALKGRLIGS